MNTSIISHRMFVAALAHDGHATDKQPPPGHAETGDSSRPAPARPTPKALAALTARPWVSWPLVGWEERSAS